MLIIESVLLLRQHIRRLRQEGKRIALVPTMGNLHDGHMKLVDEAKASADVVVVSIFVNPMQFDRVDDLARYPRTLQDDCEKLNKRHVDFVFAPTPRKSANIDGITITFKAAATWYYSNPETVCFCIATIEGHI